MARWEWGIGRPRRRGQQRGRKGWLGRRGVGYLRSSFLDFRLPCRRVTLSPIPRVPVSPRHPVAAGHLPLGVLELLVVKLGFAFATPGFAQCPDSAPLECAKIRWRPPRRTTQVRWALDWAASSRGPHTLFLPQPRKLPRDDNPRPWRQPQWSMGDQSHSRFPPNSLANRQARQPHKLPIIKPPQWRGDDTRSSGSHQYFYWFNTPKTPLRQILSAAIPLLSGYGPGLRIRGPTRVDLLAPPRRTLPDPALHEPRSTVATCSSLRNNRRFLRHTTSWAMILATRSNKSYGESGGRVPPAMSRLRPLVSIHRYHVGLRSMPH